MTRTILAEPSTPFAPAPPDVARVKSRAPDARALRAINPIMVAIHRSPLHGLLSGQMLVLTCTGRLSGRKIALPVGYVPDGEALLVVSQHSEQKRWWRNLRGGASVNLRLRGREVTARADVIEAPLDVATEIARLIDRLGASKAGARLYMDLDIPASMSPEQLATALDGVVPVRLTPEGPGRIRRRRAGVNGPREAPQGQTVSVSPSRDALKRVQLWCRATLAPERRNIPHAIRT